MDVQMTQVEVENEKFIGGKNGDEGNEFGKKNVQNNNKSGGTNVYLYTTAFIANLLMFGCGISFSWTSPIIPKLNGRIEPEKNPLPNHITPFEESWIAGLLMLGAVVGPLIGGKFTDIIGRKKLLLILGVPVLLSFIISAFANSVFLFYIARFILGISTGCAFAVLPMYLGEISEDHNRGTIGCLMIVLSTFGIVFSYIVGPYLSIKLFNLVCAIPALAFLILFGLFSPESPLYLVSCGNLPAAEAALKKLRNKSSEQIQSEIFEINKNLESIKYEKSNVMDLFRSQKLRKGFIVSTGLIILQQFCGINAVLSYMQSIFAASQSGISPDLAPIIVSMVQVVSVIVLSVIADKFGRRILLLVSTFGSSIAVTFLGVYFYLKNKDYDLDNVSWLPITSLILYIVAFNLGIGPLPWTIAGELFPSNIKAVAVMLTSSCCFLTAFSITFFFPIISEFLSMADCFLFFGIFGLLGCLFIFYIVPETKGKTLFEIQKLLGKN